MPMSKRDSAKEESEFFRKAALEFRGLLRKRSLSVDSVWNAAVHECMDLLGPACGSSHRVEECNKCWLHDKLRGALRLEASVYVPLKERMLSSLAHIRRTCTLKGPERAAYFQALDDVESTISKVVFDYE